MGFSKSEKEQMLALDGVGETVVARIEQIGFSSLSELASEDAPTLTKQISEMMGSTCWQNSPQARRAIAAMISLARSRV